MSLEDFGLLVLRWIHVIAAVIAVGGAFFMRFVLMPAAHEKLDETQHQALAGALMARWKKVVNACVGVLLLSGIANFYWVGLPKGEAEPKYHMIFGLKFMAAMGVFFLVSALTGKSAALQGIRDNRSRWLGITILLGILVILLGGYLNKMALPPQNS